MGDYNSSQRVILASLIAGIFLCIHLLATLPAPFSTWGVDMLAFYPDWVSLAFLGCGLVFLLPYSRQVLLDLSGRWGRQLDCWAATPQAFLCRFGLIAIGGGLFVALSSATHFLGDGYLYTRDLPAELLAAPCGWITSPWPSI